LVEIEVMKDFGDGWMVCAWMDGWLAGVWIDGCWMLQRAPRADAGHDPNFEQEHKSFSSSNVYLIIDCNIEF
jgi:hypothetical protein